MYMLYDIFVFVLIESGVFKIAILNFPTAIKRGGLDFFMLFMSFSTVCICSTVVYFFAESGSFFLQRYFELLFEIIAEFFIHISCNCDSIAMGRKFSRFLELLMCKLGVIMRSLNFSKQNIWCFLSSSIVVWSDFLNISEIMLFYLRALLFFI